MSQPLELSIMLTPPPPDSPSGIIASIALRCDALGLSHFGEILHDPLTQQEREDLHWYLEEYWKWPYEGFATRGKQVEAQLVHIGKRLYAAVCGTAEAASIVQAWRLHPDSQRQISILSDMPRALSLPWELLHDEQGFLVLRTHNPVSLSRRLPQSEFPAFSQPFEPPLRILLITSRPEGTGFVDPRSIARELLDETQEQIAKGTIALEFLRPPTLAALRARLGDAQRPQIHILHFDGHGTFEERVDREDEHRLSDGKQGMLAFEDNKGALDLVKADDVAQVLQQSSVRLAVLTACQSAMSAADDAFSSVAARLIKGGVDAVAAMSSSVLVASATRFVEAFYRELARGTTAPVAQERARQALHDDPRRHTHRRRRGEEGQAVQLQDWWLPHFYHQRPLMLQPAASKRKNKQRPISASTARLNEEMPPEPRYGFSGRARELLLIERWLMRGKLVVIQGFGGMGKTALAREAADWFTRIKLFDGACFVSFEHGGDVSVLLSRLGNYLGIYDAHYNPNDVRAALARLEPVLRKRKLLLIADNLESILPDGEAPLEPEDRTALWDALIDFVGMGVGLLLTSRDTELGDQRLAVGSYAAHLPLQGLYPDDAYALAINLLVALGIKRVRAPYEQLRDLLEQLGHHPLAIQLVLPSLRELPLPTIQTEFTRLLPTLVDDSVVGHNRSLIASLDYSLRRLSQEQRALLARLAVFEGGASEDDLLQITEFPEDEWIALRTSLEEAALLTAEQVHEDVTIPFLRFHPILVPYLRSQQRAEDSTLLLRYARRYYEVLAYLELLSRRNPKAARACVWQDLPNLRRAWIMLLQVGEVDAAITMAYRIMGFLDAFGLLREREQILRQVEEATLTQSSDEDKPTEAEILRDIAIARDERDKGHLPAAIKRLTELLTRVEARPQRYGSYDHRMVLHELAICLMREGQLKIAEDALRKALMLNNRHTKPEPASRTFIYERAALLCDLGEVLRDQGKYSQAKASYEQSLAVYRQVKDQRNQAALCLKLGELALAQGNYDDAGSHLLVALSSFHALGEPAQEAATWHNLGWVAEERGKWGEAERCYRESLALHEQMGNRSGAARPCAHLGILAMTTGRPAEAEDWFKHGLALIEDTEPNHLMRAGLLNNLAYLLMSEVRAGRASLGRLDEARQYAEQSLRIKEQPNISTDIWKTFAVLSDIAEMEGKPEQAQIYLRRERESFAAFPGNRVHVDRMAGALISAIAAGARGDAKARKDVGAVFPDLEQDGLQITLPVQHLWAGERDWQVLADKLNGPDALLILRVLETLVEPTEKASVIEAEHGSGTASDRREEGRHE